ncbi:MAG: MFS transporter [Spirochaetales bacterium]|nr:MFS transporter [Spirochaetales bacterium]
MIKNHNSLLKAYGINQGFHWFSLGIIIPVLTLVFLDRGFNLAQIGTAFGGMSFIILFLELPTGGIADTIGRKKVYIFSVAISVTGYVIILFAENFIHLIGITILMGTGRALSSGTMDAWFVDEHKKLGGSEELLQRDLARAGIIIPAALGAGTLIGGFLPDLSGDFFSTHTPFGYYGLNILLLITLYLLQILFTAILIKDENPNFSNDILDGLKKFPETLSSAVKYGLTRRNTLAILLTTAALGMGLAGMEQLWQPRLREISPETGIWIMGVLSAGYFAAAAAGNGASTVLLKLLGYRYRILLFFFRFIMGLIYLALSFTLSLGGFAPLYLLLFLAHGVTGSPEMVIYNRALPDSKRSTLLSLNSLFLHLGGGLGSLAAGQIAEHVTIPAAWWLTGGVLTLSALFYLIIKEDPRKNKAANANKGGENLEN